MVSHSQAANKPNENGLIHFQCFERNGQFKDLLKDDSQQRFWNAIF